MATTHNTAELRQRVAEHVAADAVIQGDYWDGSRGCWIGCLNHSNDPTFAETQYGLPIMVQRIAEAIFERLPAKEARQFFAALPDAVGCDGKDLSRVGWQFMAQVLRNMPPQAAEIQGVIDPVIAGLELLTAGKEWPDAADAANAAADVAHAAYTADAANAAAYTAAAAADAAYAAADATYAANAAAYTATNAADAAAYAATNAAYAATNAADAAADAADAAVQRQRDLLLQLFSAAPVTKSP